MTSRIINRNWKTSRRGVWLRNALKLHHRIMARFLRNRGWVVFYLEPQARKCNSDMCWLEAYRAETKEK